MMVAEEVSERTLRSSAPRFASRAVLMPYRLTLYVACTALALLVNYLIGKEMAPDTLNYHLYSGFSAVHNRFSQDYFAAGPQAYGNPYAYVPFYALVSSGLSALQVASLLAIVHSVILWLTFDLALVACPRGSDARRSVFAALAVVLAALNPILIQQIGSSFADITTGELVLAGWLLLAGSVRRPGMTRVMLAAALLGAATAFKLTNAVHAIAAAAILMMVPRSVPAKVLYGATYVISLGASFAVVTAPWSYRLELRFGNPFFPFLNNVFRSPEFTAEPLRHYRFIPSSLIDALWRPFAMLNPGSGIHEELRAPDARYAVLAILLCVILIQWLWKRYRRVRPAAKDGQSAPEPQIDWRVVGALGCAFVVDWVLWLAGSGNSRYFLPISCVGSVLIAALLFRVLGSQPKVGGYVLAAILGVQAAQLFIDADLRWYSTPWNGKWFQVEMPQTLAAESALYLVMGIQSNSFLAPYLASSAGLIDFSGGYPLTESGANGTRVKALIQRYATHLRVLILGERLYADDARRLPSISQVNGALARFGLRADSGDCATIAVRDLPPVLEIAIVSSPAPARHSLETTYLVSCRLLPDESGMQAAIAQERAADIVLDRLEDACPQLFQPRRLPTDVRGDDARRLYINTDLIAWIRFGQVKLVDPTHGGRVVLLGRESDWATAPPRLACGRVNGHYFARPLGETSSR
jgi:hypothetical protein